MSFYLAFDKNKNKELFVYHSAIRKGDTVYTKDLWDNHIEQTGTFILKFLNTDFTDIHECTSFIANYCFEGFYYKKYKKREIKDVKTLFQSEFDYDAIELETIAKEEQSNFQYVKNRFLRNLILPYDRKIDKYDGFSKLDEERREIFQRMDHVDDLMDNDISIDFKFAYSDYTDIDIFLYNIPYYFHTLDIVCILVLMLKEFKNNKKAIIRKCQNCGKYFIPENLHVTKYCNNIFVDNKTCRQIGKNITYKKFLEKDELLNKYRRRYMSLASSVGHYGTDAGISKFERYKKDGNIMKEKYINKEITAEEFEKWIDKSKMKSS